MKNKIQYKVGDKLVCIDDGPLIEPIKKNNSYIITNVVDYGVFILIDGRECFINYYEIEEYWTLDVKWQRKQKLKNINESKRRR